MPYRPIWASTLELVERLYELEAALEDPGPVALRLAIAKLRPRLEPLLIPHGLGWEDTLPTLELVEQLNELEAALEDPEAHLRKLLESAGPVALRFAVAKLRPRLKPLLIPHGLGWKDTLPALGLVEQLNELEAALEDPEAFLRKLLESAGPVTLRFAVAKLRPRLKPVLYKCSLKFTWKNALPALELVENLSELKQASVCPEVFLLELASRGGPAKIE